MKHFIIILLLSVTFPLFAQVEIVRDKATKQAYVKVEPLRPDVKQYESFVWKSETPDDCPFTQSKAYSQIKFLGVKSGFHFADTWYPTWGDDDLSYSPYTDGACWRLDGSSDFSWSGGETATTGHAVIEGDDPTNLVIYSLGTQVASSKPYEGRYPCGRLERRTDQSQSRRQSLRIGDAANSDSEIMKYI
jgi:hypothetical protein